MDPVLSAKLQHMQELLVPLLALDQLLGSVPLQQQRNLDLEAILPEHSKDPEVQEVASRYTTLSWDVGELYKVVDTVTRFDLILVTLVYVCKTSWQGRAYENVYRHSDVNKPRDPTCSEALQLLPKLDRVLKTSSSDKINAILDLVPPFRFLDLPAELRLHAYPYILPRQPYLTLIDVEPCQHALPRYDLAALRTCRQIHSELVHHFYKDQVLVMNVYDMGGYEWAIKDTTPRDRLLVLNMREETRSCFKRLEIRIFDMDDPNTYRKGSYWKAWEAMTGDELWNRDPYFTEILEAFPSLESATVSYEIEENNLRYWGGWYHALGSGARYLISNMPKHIEVRWDFQPTSHPGLQELAEEEEEIMEEVKRIVAEETAERGGTVQLGESIIKEHIVSYRPGPRGLHTHE